MAKAPVKSGSLSIELPALKVELLEVTLIGDSPLIVHAWSAKAKRQMLDTMMKKPKAPRQAKDPQDDFRQSMYRLPDGGYGFPSVAFKAAATAAATSIAGLAKTSVRQAFHIIGEDIEVDGALDGVKIRHNLVRIYGAEPRLREDVTRVGMGAADLRYRAEFSPWHTRILVRYIADILSPAQLLNLLTYAGFCVGVGEWRPQRDGAYGLFHVASEKEIEALEKPSAKRGAA